MKEATVKILKYISRLGHGNQMTPWVDYFLKHSWPTVPLWGISYCFSFFVFCFCFFVSRTSQLCLLKGARSRNFRQFQYRLTGHRIDLNVITTVCSYRKPLKKRRWAKLEKIKTQVSFFMHRNHPCSLCGGGCTSLMELRLYVTVCTS